LQWSSGKIQIGLTFLVPAYQVDLEKRPLNGHLYDYYYNYHIHLTAFFPGQPLPEKVKKFRILLEQEMMMWQWHQLDHMQIICTSLQTDNHASTSPFSFYRPDALPAAQPTASKH